MGQATQFAVACAMMATRDSGIDLEQEDRGTIGISIGTSIGGMKEAFEFHDAARLNAYRRVNPFTMGMTFPNAISSEVAIVLELHGPCETYSIGCSSTANAIGRAYEWIKSGTIFPGRGGGRKRPSPECVRRHGTPVGHWHRTNTAQSGIFPAPSTRPGAAWCWAKELAALSPEGLRACPRPRAKMYAELEGWGFTCDAHSMVKSRLHRARATTGRPAGISTAHWFPEEVDYVNACGLGTMEWMRSKHRRWKQVLGDHAYRGARQFVSKRHLAMPAPPAEPSNSSEPRGDGTPIHPTHAEFDHSDPNCDLDYVSGTGRVTRQSRADQ